MNNKDLLNKIHSRTNTLEPTDKLSPDSVEELLGGVKRRNNRAVISACVSSLCALFIAVTSIFTINNTPPSTNIPVKHGDVSAYNDIYKAVNTIVEESEEKYNYLYGDVVFNAAPDMSQNDAVTEDVVTQDTVGSDSVNLQSSNTTTEFSETNLQVSGVDEADAVKTDGKYIYSLYGTTIYITQPNNGTPKLVATIDLNDNDLEFGNIEMFIYENKLSIIAQAYTPTDDEDDIYSDVDYSSYYFGTTLENAITYVAVYDLSDISKPVKESTLTQSGNYRSSRRIDNVLYITTGYTIRNYSEIEKNKPESYCPTYNINGTTNCVPADSIIISEDVDVISYTTIASIDLNSSDDFADICSVLGSNEEVYASQKNIYVTSGYYKDNERKTQIKRFSIDGTEIAENGSFIVDGYLLNQFSMDEHNGYFRVVTERNQTYSGMYNSISNVTSAGLYIFDSNLELVGKTENVANGENVKSVRFDGDIAYFVTFRQTDPLFTVDLSDPTSPKILSELKIPGFSEYLHPFGNNLLLGFGREVDPESGIDNGLKLTMFDVTDKTNVTEISTFIFADENSYSMAEHDHKAIFVDVERKIIGIPFIIYNSDDFGGDVLQEYYHLFKYDEENKTFTSLKRLEMSEYDLEQITPNDVNTRGLYIDNFFYIVSADEIYSYNYKTFENVGYINFKK
ncbi:MAG: beta-propeller domain-containing protein [Acutalibacteraceae bacterium]